MDYFHVGIVSLQGIILALIVYLIKDRSNMRLRLEEQHMTAFYFTEGVLQDFEDKIESAQQEVTVLQKELLTIQQQQVSWVNTKKKLPDSRVRVLILHGPANSEEEAHLDSTKNFWKVFYRGSPQLKMELTLAEVSQWKPLLNKKTAPK